MSTATDREQVTVTCPDCGLSRQIQRKTYRDIRRGKRSARCHTCGNAARRVPRVVPSSPTGWRGKAACLRVDPELFFPIGEPGSKAYERAAQPARAVCAECPVMLECLEDALQAHDKWAIRGGLDPDERGEQFGVKRRRKQVAIR